MGERRTGEEKDTEDKEDKEGKKGEENIRPKQAPLIFPHLPEIIEMFLYSETREVDSGLGHFLF